MEIPYHMTMHVLKTSGILVSNAADAHKPPLVVLTAISKPNDFIRNTYTVIA